MEDKILNKRKNGIKLSYDEIKYMIDSYIKNKISEEKIVEFVMSIYKDGLSYEETSYLTDVMVKSGEIVDLSAFNKPCVDKHSVGGIGDKVTLLISPIVASLGVVVPKMSGRGLGITGGTVDKLESIPGFKLEVPRKDFIKQLDQIGVSVISQSEKIAVADKKIYALRNEIGAVDSIPLIASSIMSKKIASGADNIVIDLKVGDGAFMKKIKNANKLAKTMIKIGEYYNKKVVCVLTDMNIPLGNNIGNALEVKEAIDFFDGIRNKRLYSIAVYISAIMVSVSKNMSFKKAKELVIGSIESGLARSKFYEWINYQGGDLNKFKIKAKTLEVISDKDGYINEIDASDLGDIVFELGAGRVKKTDKIDYNVGVVINKNVGEKVEKGDSLATIYYNKKVDNAVEKLKKAFIIRKRKKRVKSIIIKTIK